MNKETLKNLLHFKEVEALINEKELKEMELEKFKKKSLPSHRRQTPYSKQDYLPHPSNPLDIQLIKICIKLEKVYKYFKPCILA